MEKTTEDKIFDAVCEAFCIPRELMNVDFGSHVSKQNEFRAIEKMANDKAFMLAGLNYLRIYKPKHITLAIDLCNSAGAIFTPIQVIELKVCPTDMLRINSIVSRSKYFKRAHMAKNEDGANTIIYNFSIMIYDNHEINLSGKDKVASLAKYKDPLVMYYLNHLANRLDKVFNFDAAAEVLTQRMDDEWCKPLY